MLLLNPLPLTPLPPPQVADICEGWHLFSVEAGGGGRELGEEQGGGRTPPKEMHLRGFGERESFVQRVSRENMTPPSLVWPTCADRGAGRGREALHPHPGITTPFLLPEWRLHCPFVSNLHLQKACMHAMISVCGDRIKVVEEAQVDRQI